MQEIKIAIRVVTMVLGIALYASIWSYLGMHKDEILATNRYILWSWVFINVFALIMIILWAFS